MEPPENETAAYEIAAYLTRKYPDAYPAELILRFRYTVAAAIESGLIVALDAPGDIILMHTRWATEDELRQALTASQYLQRAGTGMGFGE